MSKRSQGIVHVKPAHKILTTLDVSETLKRKVDEQIEAKAAFWRDEGFAVTPAPNDGKEHQYDTVCPTCAAIYIVKWKGTDDSGKEKTYTSKLLNEDDALDLWAAAHRYINLTPVSVTPEPDWTSHMWAPYAPKEGK